MRFSDGVNKYHDDKKQSILNSVLDSAQTLPSGEKDREGIIMSTNKNNTKAAMVKSSKGGIIAAACAVVMLGGAVAFFSAKSTDSNTEIKTNYGGQLGGQSESFAPVEDSRSEDASVDSTADNASYSSAKPAAVIAPDDNGKIVEGFEGYDIEVKYLLEDVWKGLDGHAQHSYGVVIDVSAKDGYKLPWADEETSTFFHLGDLFIDNGRTDRASFFTPMNPKNVTSCGYKAVDEDGRDVLRFVLVADVDDNFKLDKNTKITFDVTTVFWGDGDPFKTEGKFTASVTFDEARTLDLALMIPYEIKATE